MGRTSKRRRTPAEALVNGACEAVREADRASLSLGALKRSDRTVMAYDAVSAMRRRVEVGRAVSSAMESLLGCETFERVSGWRRGTSPVDLLTLVCACGEGVTEAARELQLSDVNARAMLGRAIGRIDRFGVERMLGEAEISDEERGLILESMRRYALRSNALVQ